jgi:hypothetical protein
MRPFVQLEVGGARVTPFELRDLPSFVHEELVSSGQLSSFVDNQAAGVSCVHPLVTLLEKLDAVHRRFRNNGAAATFVRHFEDAAHIIALESSLPRLKDYPDVGKLAEEMVDQKQLAELPALVDPAFRPVAGTRWNEIQRAHTAIGPMFWGARIPLEDACESIRTWIAKVFGG